MTEYQIERELRDAIAGKIYSGTSDDPKSHHRRNARLLIRISSHHFLPERRSHGVHPSTTADP